MNRFSIWFFALMSFAGLSFPCYGQYGPQAQQFPGGGGFGGGFGGYGGGGFAGGGNIGGSQNVTPYLNLLVGKSAAVNYLSAVAPYTQQSGLGSRSIFFDPTALRRYNLEGPDDSIPQLPETGHPVRFLTYFPYYNLGANVQRSNLLYPFRPQPKSK